MGLEFISSADIWKAKFYRAKAKVADVKTTGIGIFSRYSRIFQAAFIFVNAYALVVFAFAIYHILTDTLVTHNEYARLVSERLMSGRVYTIPVFFVLFQLSFWKQKYFSEVLIACAAWIGANYIEDYFTLGSRFLTSYLLQPHLLLALRPLMLIALIWMAIEQRHQR